MKLDNWGGCYGARLPLAIVTGFQLTQDADCRAMLGGAAFSTKAAYRLLWFDDSADTSSCIWASRLPARVKIFGWLLHLNRLNTRQNLHHKTIIDSPFCPTCSTTVEDQLHLFFDCPAVRSVWRQAQLDPQIQAISDIWTPPSNASPPSSVWPAHHGTHNSENLGQ
jgi:antitoxin component of MazEF toxin-antitoxin module